MSNDRSPAPAGADKLTSQQWGVIGVLLLLQATWSLDRSLPMLLVEPLRHAFKLSDSQLGMVVGLAYGTAYGIGGLLIGPLLDQYNRARMLSGMAFLWSGLTALCAFVSTFPLLLALRFGIGAAESGGSPASYTIISDVFPPHRRATMIGIFKTGSPLGLLAATVISGTVAVHFGWQAAFLLAGVPGALLAVAVIFVVPGARKPIPADDRPPYSLVEALRFMAKAPEVRWLMAAIIVFLFAAAGAGAFMMSLFQRVHGVSLQNMSWIYGTGQALGLAGPLLAAIACDRLLRRDIRLTLALLMGISVASMVSGLVMALSDNLWVAAGGMLATQVAGGAMTAPAFAVLLTLTPVQMRGTVTGTLSALMYLLGIGPAPVVTGMLSDALGGGEMVRYAMALTLLLNFAVLACLAMSSRALAGWRRPESEAPPIAHPA